MPRTPSLSLFALAGMAFCLGQAMGGDPVPPAELAFFETKIRPVLVTHCYSCHSADAETVGGKLLLDSRKGLLDGGESGPALVPGKPAESLILDALHYNTFEMPPDQPLPEVVIQDFSQWIERGAWDPRTTKPAPSIESEPDREAVWSFLPRRSVSPPEIALKEWPQSSLDRFILHRIEEAGLAPTHDADARSLARRLYFDLIGLPPSWEELERFVQQCEKDRELAIEQLVDELLSRPQFGEQWGRHWLDVARYGESNGNDGLSRNATFPHAWRYRDYVIDALNRDVPYDRFVVEQVAGDLLPAETATERTRLLVATGFLAIGSKPASAMNKDFPMDIVDDQINTVSTAILGLSVACARCHDHKHDPIPTRDYYALAGIFTSTETLYGLAGNEKLTAPPTPLHSLTSELPNTKAATDQRRASLELPETYQQAVATLKPDIHCRLDAAPEALETVGEVNFTPAEFARLKSAHLLGQVPTQDDDYSVAFWFKNETPNDARPITAYLFSRAKFGDKGIAGDHLGIGGKHDPERTGKLFVFNGNVEKKQSIAGKTVIAPGTWNHVVLIRRGDRVKLFLNGADEPEIDAQVTATFGDNRQFSLGIRSDEFSPLDGSLADFSLYARAISDSNARSLHEASGQPRGIRQLGLAMGVREKKEPSDCKIHINGEGAKLGPVVPRGVLTAYNMPDIAGTHGTAPPMSEIPKSSSGRRELAQWLTHPEHPQTARVMANRIWLNLMGEGLVATPDDFGVYGARPTHPELLDWLAQRFVDEGWSIKRLIRTIVLSRTYQLASEADSDHIQKDPDNRLWARHTRRRLTAEQYRDAILTASGQLQLEPGQGSAIEELDVLINKPPHEAATLHRPSNHRSIYLCMLRNAPPPELAAFDLPDGLAVAGKRSQTILPAQALFMLNNEFVLDQAEHLAAELLASANATPEDRVQMAFRRTLQRSPTPEETAAAMVTIEQLEQLHTSSASSPVNTERSLSPWGAFCQALFATNEFRYID